MAGANVFKVPVLKITAGNEVLINSRSSKQEIFPISKETLKRDVNSKLIENKTSLKLRSVIETKDDINIKALKKSIEMKKLCKIYSMVQFCTNTASPLEECVEDSVETEDGITSYRPILNMILTNFVCKATIDGDQVWKLEFEEP